MNRFNPVTQITVVVALIGSVKVASAQNTLILAPERDVVVGYHDNYNSANTNYNSATHWSAISQPGTMGGVNNCRSLMDFDLDAIPQDATVFGAFLTLSASGPLDNTGDVTSVGSSGANACKLVRVTSPWNANTVTWNNQPTTTASNAVQIPASNYAMQNYLSIDVTALIQDLVSDPANSHGFMIELDNETPSRGLCFFGGLAPETDKQPQLVVVYGDCGTANIGVMDGGDSPLTVSPNLLSSGAMIHLDMRQPPVGNAQVVLFNALGQTVFSRPAAQWPMAVTVPALAQGTYTWKVQGPTGTALGMARMVVQ